MNIARRISEKAFTLIEMLMVISIISVLAVGAFTFFNQASSGARASQAKQDIQGFIINIRDLYQGQPDYDGLTNQVVIDSGIVPNSMGVSGTEITNRFGGQVSATTSDDITQFDLQYGGLPRSACVELATLNTDVASVEINGSTFSDIPVSVSEATTNCNDSDANSITYIAD